jgi:hypothetical protein
VVTILVEMAKPSSILAAAARPWLTMVQGAWWIQTAYIMYRSQPQWDPEYMGSGMMVPVPFVLWMLGTALFLLLLLLLIKFVAGGQKAGGGHGGLGVVCSIDSLLLGGFNPQTCHCTTVAALPCRAPCGPQAQL